MNSKWPSVKLGEYCLKIGSGATPRGGSKVYLDAGEFTLIRSQNIYNAGFNKDGLVYITNEAAEKLKNVEVSPLDILLNITGDSVARVCIAPQEHLPARVNQHVAIVRPIPGEFDANFLRYFLTSPSMKNELLSITISGATRNALTKGDIESLNIPKPEINTQKKISHYLITFDNKIVLNNKINQTLEAIAQATFKSWFIDFDPVKAKMAVLDVGGDEEQANLAAMMVISSKSQDELEAFKANKPEQYAELYEIAKMFPNDMEDSDLGEIPKGWTVGNLSNIAQFQNGFAFKQTHWTESGNPVVKIKNIKQGVVELEDCSYIDETAHSNIEKFKLSEGDLLVGMTGANIGETGILLSQKNTAYQNQRVGRIETPNKLEDIAFIYCIARHPRYKQFIEDRAEGSAQPNISGDALMSYSIVVPFESIYKSFNKITSCFIKKILLNHSMNRTFAELRDTLLPRLLSGQIELPIDSEDGLDGVANG